MMGLLNTPIQVKDFVIKNRLVMPPMATAKASPAGKVTNELCEYYEEKSKGGYFGLIITEHSFISRQGKAHKGQVSISMDSDIKELEKSYLSFTITIRKYLHKSIMPEAQPKKK